MKVQTILESGASGLAQAVGIDRSRLTLQSADGGMVTSEPARMDAIRDAPFPDDMDLPRLTQKQLDRIAAFALRDEIGRDR
jgi:hypothetical protein